MKKMTNLYAKAMETSVKQSGIAPMKYFLTLVMLLVLGAWASFASAECTYSLSNTPSRVNVVQTGKSWIGQKLYNFPDTELCTLDNTHGIAKISFSMKKDGGWNNGAFKLQYYNGSGWSDALDDYGNVITWNVKDSETTTVSKQVNPNSSTGKASKFQIVRTSDTDFTSNGRYFTISNIVVVMAKTLSGSTETMDFGEQMCETTSAAKIRTFAFTNDETVKISNTNSEEFNATLSKTTDCVGSATITVTFTPKYKGERTGTIAITGAAGSKTFTVKGIGIGKAEQEFNANFQQSVADNLLVDGSINNAFTFTNVSNDDKFTYSIEVKNISSIAKGNQVISYDAFNNRIIAHNAGVATLQFTQGETDDYIGKSSVVYTFTVSKHANGLRCTGDTWSKTMTFDQTIETVFTANNTDYANTPIQVKQTTGENIAQYVSGKVNSFHNEGTATWTIWQEEDINMRPQTQKF